jgi:pyruvate kinase
LTTNTLSDLLKKFNWSYIFILRKIGVYWIGISTRHKRKEYMANEAHINGTRTIKRTKILATLGPATDDRETLERILRAGVNGCRMNFSHGTEEQRLMQIKNVREISGDIGRHVAILQDIQGPKIRLGALKDDMRYDVHAGDELGLTFGIEHDGNNNLPSQYDLSEKVKVGEIIYLFDGKIRTHVTRIENRTVWISAENDGFLLSRKAINLPDTDFGGDFLTEKDYADLAWGLDKDFDYTAISFVHTAEDVKSIREWFRERGVDRLLVSKIETRQAIADENLEKIVKASDGVMVARGDLAVEAGAEVVPVVQRKIIALCQKYGKFSIVATQMLASMVENPEPTRAEVSDIATASIEGADVVMLSDETAMGKYPVEAVTAMRNTLLYSQRYTPVDQLHVRESNDSDEHRDAVAEAAIALAERINADAIVVETTSGRMARNVAAHRSRVPILAVSQSLRVANQMSLLFNTLGFTGEGDDYGWATTQKIFAAGFFYDQTKLKLVVVRRVPSDSERSRIANTVQLRILEK